MSASHSDTDNASFLEALALRVLPGRELKPLEFLHLRNSALAGEIRIFRDSLDRPIGYVSWAMVNRASLDRLLRSGRLPTYPYEWNEGGFCLILDVLIAGYGRCEALRKLRQFARGHRAVVYVSRGRRVRVLLRRGGRLRAWSQPVATSLRTVLQTDTVALLGAAAVRNGKP